MTRICAHTSPCSTPGKIETKILCSKWNVPLLETSVPGFPLPYSACQTSGTLQKSRNPNSTIFHPEISAHWIHPRLHLTWINIILHHKPTWLGKGLVRLSMVLGFERKLTRKEIQVWAPAHCEIVIETCLVC